MTHRRARVYRETSESTVDVAIDLDGAGGVHHFYWGWILRPYADGIVEALRYRYDDHYFR